MNFRQAGYGLVLAAGWLLAAGLAPAQQTLSGAGLEPSAPAESTAVAGSGGGIINVNQFLGADRYYNYSTPITGQNSITYNLEAGHIWNGHESLAHVTTYSQTTENVGGGAVAPLYDRHATWVGMLIGGRQTAVNPQPMQQGIAPLTDLRSAAVASQWNGVPYKLNFGFTTASFVNAFDTSFGTADVVNSSWGGTDPGGTSQYAIAADAYAFSYTSTTYVTSAGNSGSGANTVTAPGAGYNSITVAALTKGSDPVKPYDSAAGFSGRGPQTFAYYNGFSNATTTVAGVRAPVDIAAPGDELTSAYYGGSTGGNTGGTNDMTATTYTGSLQGTSFSAPLVAGGASLMASAAHTLPQLSANPNATNSMVVKSLLLTGADKTTGWSNGLATVTESGNTFLRTTQSLDWVVGAGRMNLDKTFDLQLNGTRDVTGTATGLLGDVSPRGWDYGWANRGINNDYVFSTLFDGMTQVDMTLSWQRVRGITPADVYTDYAQANLTLSFWSLDITGAFDQLIAESASLYNTVEHLSFQVPTSGNYGLRVSYPANTYDLSVGGIWGNLSNPQEYGLAWSVSSIPETTTLVPLAVMLGSSLCLRVRRRVRFCPTYL